MNVEKELREIISEVLENHAGIFMVGFKHTDKIYEITIDGDTALGIYDISEVSREINHKADERMPEEQYSLDVSSPGADSDLIYLRQYPKHIGREFMVYTRDESLFKGKLVKIDGEQLEFHILSPAKGSKKALAESRIIAFKDINKANIILSFK